MAMDASPPDLNLAQESPITTALIYELMNLSKYNTRRRRNKKSILKKMAVDPNTALKNLSQLSLSFSHLRSKCFTLLRQHICKNNQEISSEALVEVKPILLSCLEQVSVNENPKKLCEVVANVAFRLSEFKAGPWLELLDYIASSVNSDDEWTQELGVMMFCCFPEKILEHLQNHFDSIRSAVFWHLASTRGNLRELACMASVNLAKLAHFLWKECEVDDLVPMMIMSINKSLNDQENIEIPLGGLENLRKVLEEQATFYEEQFNKMFESMVAIAENKNVTPQVKAKAFEVIKGIDEVYTLEVSCALENLPWEIIERSFGVWMDMLTSVDDDPDWHNVDGEGGAVKIIVETESFSIGLYFLDRISYLLSDRIYAFAFNTIQKFVAPNQNWRKRLAGIATLSLISELCSQEFMGQYLERMISLALNILEDQDLHPRLCYDALYCVITLCTEWAPFIQMQYHGWILPALTKLSCHPDHHRNQIQQAKSIHYCCRSCSPENLEPFMADIVPKVQELCQSNSLITREWAVSALGTVATSAQDRFTQFYDTAMKTLKGLLASSYQESSHKIGARCLETITAIATVVGKEKFLNDANQVMEVLVSTLRSLKSHHSIKMIILQALENLFCCLGQDFSSFLKDLMPVLLLSCKSVSESNNEEQSPQGLENNKGQSPQGLENNNGQSPQGSANNSLALTEHNLALDVNALAWKLLTIFASELKEKNFPWITKAAITHISMLDKKISDVTMEAAPVLPKLLEASKLAVEKGESEGCTVSYVENLVNLIIPALLKAFDKVVHKRMYATLFKSLSECAQISGPFIALDHITQITDRIQKDFSSYSLRKKVRVHEQKQDDPLKKKEEEELLNEVSNCLVTLIQQYRANFLPNLGHKNLNLLIKNLWDDGCTCKEKKIAFSIFRNIVRECQEDAHQYYDMYLPPLLKACMDNDLEVRKEAALGITACAEFGTSNFKDIARGGAMDFLPQVIRNLEELSVENGNAYEIAVSVLKEVCESHRTSVFAHEGNIPAWQQRPSIRLELNVGVLVQERHSIAAVVGRDLERDVCLLYSGLIPCTDTLQVEAHAIWLALISASDNCWPCIVVQSESTDVVSRFNHRSLDCPPNIDSIVESAWNFGKNFSQLSFTHVDRIYNFMARNFAKWALLNKKIGFVDFGEVPSSIFEDVKWAEKLGT